MSEFKTMTILWGICFVSLFFGCSMPSNVQEVPQVGEWSGASGNLALTSDSLGWGAFFEEDTVFWWLDGKYCYSLTVDEKDKIDYDYVMSGTIQGRSGMLLAYIQQADSWSCDVQDDSLVVDYRNATYRFSRSVPAESFGGGL